MAPERIQVGDLWIQVTRKNIKNVHLSVYPPDGRVTLSAPADTRLDAARAYAVSKLGWIRRQQKRLRQQVRESRRQYVTRESHYLWGRRYLLAIVESNTRPVWCWIINALPCMSGPAADATNGPRSCMNGTNDSCTILSPD